MTPVNDIRPICGPRTRPSALRPQILLARLSRLLQETKQPPRLLLIRWSLFESFVSVLHPISQGWIQHGTRVRVECKLQPTDITGSRRKRSGNGPVRAGAEDLVL
jgi:hypothetical protein